MVDPAVLRSSFGRVAEHGDEVPLYFYSLLFLRHPQLRSMFPPSMAGQRDRLVGALVQIVTDVDRTDALVPYLENLGRDHRKFAVVADHYPQVGEALLATLEHFLGDAWTADLASQWQAAYGVVAEVMLNAADRDGANPAWWDAEIVTHERRCSDLAVFTVRPEAGVAYRPGQSLSVETTHRPNMWRYYSPANAPREDGTLEFHVRAVDGGWVSSALVFSAGVGDCLRLGPAVGELFLESTDDPLLLIAGGTGLAPLRAMVEDLAARGGRRAHLYVEARTEAELYDQAALARLSGDHTWLTVVPVLLDGGSPRFHSGRAAAVALRQGTWDHHRAYVCGGPRMVASTRELLAQGGLPEHRIRHETFSYRCGPVSADPPDDRAAASHRASHEGPVDGGPGDPPGWQGNDDGRVAGPQSLDAVTTAARSGSQEAFR
jgi:NAD(P)H-flavin reductase/hemoglobin-like flavoprotein